MRIFMFFPSARVFFSMSNLSWVLLLTLWSSSYAQQSRCFDGESKPIYDPCYCEGIGQGNLNITCIGVDNQIIKDIFLNSIEPEINRFALVPMAGQLNQLNIDANLLSDKRARVIHIASCPDVARSLQIHPEAFRSSSDYAQQFSVMQCDFNQVNWNFLENFRELRDIHLVNVDGIQSINSLPTLESIKQLSFTDCMGFSNPLLEFPAKSLVPLETLVLDGNTDLSNEVANSIMSTLASDAVQLGSLTLINSPLINQIPENIGGIFTLKSVNLSSNSIGSISSDVFNFPGDLSVRLIDLSNNKIRTISANAFSQGDYGDAIIRLDNNLLTSFEWNVFLEVLDEMDGSSGSGVVSIAKNRIACVGCDLAWIIRDNRNLLQWVSGGTCLDGTGFEDLDPDDFDSTCAVITPVPETTSTTELPTTKVTTTIIESTTITSTSESSTTELPTTQSTSTTITTTSLPTTTSTTVLPTTTTSTTLLPTTTTSTTLLPTTSTTLVPTTVQPNNNEDLQLLLLYITLGLVGVSVLILIFSCIYMIYYRPKNKRKSTIPEAIDKVNNPQGYPVVPTSNLGPGIPRPTPIVVQGPGGKWYTSNGPANAYGPAAKNPVKSK